MNKSSHRRIYRPLDEPPWITISAPVRLPPSHAFTRAMAFALLTISDAAAPGVRDAEGGCRRRCTVWRATR